MIKSFIYGGLQDEIKKMFDYRSDIPSVDDSISVIIPIRITKIDRLQNLICTIQHLLKQDIKNLEIIVAEEDRNEKIRLSMFSNSTNINKIYIGSNDKLFNKSIAINCGVMKSKYDKICMCDGDLIFPRNYLSRIADALNSYEGAFLLKDIYQMERIKDILTFKGKIRNDYFTGGSLGFKKQAFLNIGGMCEAFKGYGSEDCEFWSRFSKLNIREERIFTCLHMPHFRETGFSQNVKLYDKIMSQNIEERNSGV